MKKKFLSPNKNINIDKTLEKLTLNKGAPKFVFALLIIFFFFCNYLTVTAAASKNIINFLGIKIAISAFTGVFSSLANISIIFLAVLFWKVGYYTALILLLIQFPQLTRSMLQRQNPNNIAGLFTNLSAIIAATIIYLNNLRIAKYQDM